jgi:chromosome segregation ATPase
VRSRAEAEAAADALRRRQAELKAEITGLLYERDSLQGELVRIRTEYDNFATYERKARAILDAKDQELQARQAQLEDGERFLKTRRSFLPEM